MKMFTKNRKEKSFVASLEFIFFRKTTHFPKHALMFNQHST